MDIVDEEYGDLQYGKLEVTTSQQLVSSFLTALGIGDSMADSGFRQSSAPQSRVVRGTIKMGQLGLGVAMKLKDARRPVPLRERVGVAFPRYFTERLEEGRMPYDDAKWELRTATIGNDKGAVIFEQRDVEVPADWSQ